LLLVEDFRISVEGMADREVEVGVEHSSPVLAVEATITSTASSNISSRVRRQNR
jgi:hypothetical protein